MMHGNKEKERLGAPGGKLQGLTEAVASKPFRKLDLHSQDKPVQANRDPTSLIRVATDQLVRFGILSSELKISH